jgi:hypothetical protein
MNASRLFAIVGILLAASLAWGLLSSSVTQRTHSAESSLGAEVERMFGPPLVQRAPRVEVGVAGASAPARVRLADATDATVAIEHEQRNRGLVWFSVYRVRFDATYTVTPLADASGDEPARFTMELPSEATIDGLEVLLDGKAVRVESARIDLPLALRREAVVRVAYRASGRDEWRYEPRADEGSLRRFRLTLTTDFDAVDYPVTGLSPTRRAAPRSDGRPGIEAAWEYAQMLPAKRSAIGVLTPRRPDAGRFAARLSTFAPVSLLFFFVVLVVIQVLKGWRLHPLHYLQLAAAFFAFHILLAYLVDHVPLEPAFWIAAATSMLLVVSYLRLVLGARSAILVAGGAQLAYLVLFSYAFFWEGVTGLTIVLGGIGTLFLVMQLTGRLDWDRVLRGEEPAPAAGG